MELNSITHTTIISGSVNPVTYGRNTSSQFSGGRNNSFALEDTVTLSQEGKDKATKYKKSSFAAEKSATGTDPSSLNRQELMQLQQLRRRDTEVRTHEQAHLSAAGQYARGGASFTYQKGPDGGSYAIGGEVGIDITGEATPEATITKMQTIKRAALAPANPSGADKMIAAQANVKETQARQELLQIQQEELLRGESTEYSFPKNQAVNDEDGKATGASTYGSLKTKLAAYEKMAESRRDTNSST
jgi:hypothetical protein